MASEEILQFIWKHRLFTGNTVKTTCGINLEIITPGEQNYHAGPDFFNARIIIEHMIWAGNVEIHQSASDWQKHGHHHDPAYDNVILHVVGKYDFEIRNSKGRRIPALELSSPGHMNLMYDALKKNENWLPCHRYIGETSSRLMQQWYTALHAERLKQKTGHISKFLLHPGENHDEVLYKAMASGFGIPVNSIPFEMLATGIPYNLLLELRDNLHDLEALLFGFSGLLHAPGTHDGYPFQLLKRFREIKTSFHGKSVPFHLWKFLRLRPASFPTLRLSQFASLVHLRFPLTKSVLATGSITEIEQLLRVKASVYWDTHYVFGKCSPPAIKKMGHQSILVLIINVIIPFLCATSKQNPQNHSIAFAREILSELKAESNHIIKNWATFGIKPKNAYESQALIHLHNTYCKQKRCLECRIGAGIIESEVHEAR